MTEHVKQILVDAFGRVRELVIDLTDGLTDDLATYRPDRGELHCMAGLAPKPDSGRSRGRLGAGRAGVAGVAGKVWVAVRQVGYRLQSGSGRRLSE